MILPRVTEILVGAGLINTAFMTEAGRERGRAVHLACQYLDENDLDSASIDPAIAGYVEAYRGFRREQVQAQDAMWIECPQQDSRGLYRGTPDRILVARPRAIWDLKSGAYEAWHPIQLAAYVNMMDDPFAYRRIGIYLRPDGKYSIREFPKTEYIRDLNVFLSALNIYNWRMSNGNVNGNRSAQ